MSTESIESIASQSFPAAAVATCAACGAPLADDQRYCLHCGERTVPMSSVLLAGTPLGAAAQAQAGPGASSPAPQGPPTAATAPGAGEVDGRGNALTVIAGVGVLLLAMGIGVLIGRSGASKPSSAAPQVISVAAPGTGGATPASSEAFTGDWPVDSSGYTVQLQTLPTASTQVSAVQAAKSAAEGKGAKSVGALESDEFASLAAGSFVIYSGKYAKKAEAQKALGRLKKDFPGATVIHVGSASGKSAGKASGTGSGAGGKSGVGATPSNPAPPSVVESLKSKSGKSYEEQSKNLPNVVSTG